MSRMMGKLSAHEITKVLHELVGFVYGNEDNLKTLIDVTKWCLDEIYIISLTRYNPNSDERNTGERAFSAIAEWADWAKKVIEEE